MSAQDRLDAALAGADAGVRSSVTAAEPGRALRAASRWWIGGGVGLVAIIALGTATAILTAHRNAVSLAQRALQNMAFVLAARANSEFDAIERVQRNLIDRFEDGLASPGEFERKFSGSDVHAMLKEKHLGLPYIGAFSLVNAEGKLFILSRLWPAPNIDASDQNSFVEFKSHPTVDFTVSEPLRNRLTGGSVFHLARKVNTIRGQFAGVVLVTIEIDQFQKSFQSIVLGQGSSLALFRRDAMLLARYRRLASIIGHD